MLIITYILKNPFLCVMEHIPQPYDSDMIGVYTLKMK